MASKIQCFSGQLNIFDSLQNNDYILHSKIESAILFLK